MKEEECMQTHGVTNPADTRPLRVGVVHWYEDERGDGIVSLLSRTLGELGCETINFFHDGKLPGNLDVVFVYGPFGSLVPLVNQLLACPSSQRPLLVFRMSEQLPNPDLPEWVRSGIGLIRSQAERSAFREQAPGQWQVTPLLRWATTKANRFRYYGDLHWLQRQGILSLLVIGHRLNGISGDCLRTRGINTLAISLGSHPSWGEDLGLKRDIPVLWIGNRATSRRARLLDRIRLELRERGVEMTMIDGVEHPYVFNEERTVLLNRTKIVLNLLRAKWDSNSLRYFISAPNRAMIVTEPVHPPNFFVPGTHLIEVPIEHMADTVCHYLAHEEERRFIADQAYKLVTTDLTMKRGLARVLEAVAELR
jgi:hypothetical protein